MHPHNECVKRPQILNGIFMRAFLLNLFHIFRGHCIVPAYFACSLACSHCFDFFSYPHRRRIPKFNLSFALYSTILCAVLFSLHFLLRGTHSRSDPIHLIVFLLLCFLWMCVCVACMSKYTEVNISSWNPYHEGKHSDFSMCDRSVIKRFGANNSCIYFEKCSSKISYKMPNFLRMKFFLEIHLMLSLNWRCSFF